MSVELSLDLQLIASIAKNIDDTYPGFLKKREDPVTLLSGISGCSLFYSYYYLKTGNKSHLEKACELVDLSVDRLSQIQEPSLYQGFTGIAWLIRHLVNIGIYDKSTLDNLEELDDYIWRSTLKFADHKYYSLMYGFIGQGIYYAEALQNEPNNKNFKSNLKQIVQILDEISIKTPEGTTWIDRTSLDHHEKIATIFNLGIPHGVTGIILFLSKMIELQIEVALAKKLIKSALFWLLSKKGDFSGMSAYPSLIVDNQEAKITRLSWAYGDLCSVVALLQGYKHLNEELFLEEAKKTVSLTFSRNIENSIIHRYSKEETINPGICIGACGIILLYEYIKEFMGETELDHKVNYWLDNMMHRNDSILINGDFKSFNIKENKETFWKMEIGFLEGLSGIGLTLLYLNDKSLNDWKRLILL